MLACLSEASLASAQTAVLFPIGGDADLAPHGVEALGRAQRDLEESSFTVLTGDALGGTSVQCADPSCAGPLLTALHADIGVGIALWHRRGVVQVSVVLVDPHGVQVSADADGTEGVIGQATQSALSQARARWATRGGSPVRLVGSPADATIVVDGAPWGTLPHEGALAPGTHEIVVSADGYATERRDVEIASGVETVELSFELRSTSEPAPPAVASAGPDLTLVGVGAGAAAVGVGLLVTGVVIASGTETCVSGCTGPAVDRVVAVPATELGIGLAVAGVVALGVGVVLVVLGVTASHASTPVALGPGGLAVSF